MTRQMTFSTDFRAYGFILIQAIIFMFPHSMAPWGNGNYPTDVCVYYRCAEWINQGLVMYQDMFDHKGPLVYLSYWLATRLFGLQGIWCMDTFIVFALFVIFYKTARLYTDSERSLLITFLMGLYYQLPFSDGGGPEWLATLGCSYTVYLLAKHLKSDTYCSFGEMFVLSVAVAVCLLTKFNTSAVIIPVAMYFLYHLIRNFDTQVFMMYCGAVVAGLVLIFAPVLYWMYLSGNIAEFIDTYWVFNTSKYENEIAISRGTAILTITLICIPAYLFYGLFVWWKRHNRLTLFWVSLAFYLPLILNGYVKNGYPHYLFPCFAAFAWTLAMIWDELCLHKKLYRIVVSLCMIIGLVTFGVRTYLRVCPFDNSHDMEVASFLNTNRGDSEYVMVYPFVDRIVYKINAPAYSFNYRLWLLLDGKPASKYFYFPPGMTDKMHQESLCQIREHAPLWVVAQEQNSQDIIRLGYSLYSCDEYGFQILKRK